MPAHTPGPWTIQESRTEWDIYSEHTGAEDSACVGRAYTESDAHLIAAAPALLEALRDLMSYETEMIREYVPITIRDKARAAIARAKGESHGHTS